MEETKPFKISKQIVKIAFDRVKANKGTYGIDEQTIADFEENLKDNLYKIWNRMSSGTYFPKPVKAVAIPKKNGGTRILGIPTVEDRVAQMVAKIYFEPGVEKLFYEDNKKDAIVFHKAEEILDKKYQDFIIRDMIENLDEEKDVYC